MRKVRHRKDIRKMGELVEPLVEAAAERVQEDDRVAGGVPPAEVHDADLTTAEVDSHFRIERDGRRLVRDRLELLLHRREPRHLRDSRPVPHRGHLPRQVAGGHHRRVRGRLLRRWLLQVVARQVPEQRPGHLPGAVVGAAIEAAWIALGTTLPSMMLNSRPSTGPESAAMLANLGASLAQLQWITNGYLLTPERIRALMFVFGLLHLTLRGIRSSVA